MKNKKDNIIQKLETCPICQSKDHQIIKKAIKLKKGIWPSMGLIAYK